jgi:hypothetical protein
VSTPTPRRHYPSLESKCDRCGRPTTVTHYDGLGHICLPCYVGNPDNPIGRLA